MVMKAENHNAAQDAQGTVPDTSRGPVARVVKKHAAGDLSEKPQTYRHWAQARMTPSRHSLQRPRPRALPLTSPLVSSLEHPSSCFHDEGAANTSELKHHSSDSPHIHSNYLFTPGTLKASSKTPTVVHVSPLRSPSLEILEERTITQPVYRNQDGVEFVGEPRPTKKSCKVNNLPATEILTGLSAMKTPTAFPRSPSLEILEDRTIYPVQPVQRNQDDVEIIGEPRPTSHLSRSYKRKRR